MAKLQTAVNKVKRLEEQINPVNNMPEGLGAGVNTAMRDLPTQTVQPTAQQPSQADLYAILEKRRLQALEQQKRNALATLKQEKAQVNPAFHTGLSNIAGQSARQARNLAEYLAQRGQTQSGIAAQGEMQMQSDLLSQQGLLEQQRINALADIARRESEVRSAYDSGALDAAMERQYNTLQGQLAEQERARQEGIATVGQYYDDYAAQLNKIAQMEAMGDYSQSYLKPYLIMARQEKMARQAEAQAKAEQQAFENWLAIQKLKNQNLRKTGSGGSSGGGGTPTYKPTLTAAQARDAMDRGIINEVTVAAFNSHYGTNYTVDEARRMFNNITMDLDYFDRRDPLNIGNKSVGAYSLNQQKAGNLSAQDGTYLRLKDLLGR